MKKILAILVLTLMPSLFFGQTAFDKYDGEEGVTAVVIGKKMFEMMGNVKSNDKEAQQYMNLVKKLESLKVFVTSSPKITADMKVTSAKYLKTAALEELMRVNDGGKNIKIYVKSGASSTKVKELLMFIEGGGKDETVLMSLTGNFDLNEISMLTDKMNIPGGDALKKGTKGKK
ncbi:DUF4252 domain-containing protein [Flavobacterium macacae]|uniref:DUF4252 domain-containing protein n=1 Tax=Flavobacterium macacae TaxID=2488993 RepID=A0A3P3WBC1_9FLAO|nr:DUF4252 domain-containing protein [Flavobacterium macacae]RRJ92481.1 DUF4252 domain-containing protein [Flavobacterium macacae]